MPLDSIINGPFLGTSRNPYSYEKVEQIDRDITTSWLTLDEIQQQLNLFQDDSQDDYLLGLELATRMAIEDFIGLTIFPVTYRVYYGASNTYGVEMILDLPEVSQDSNNSRGVAVKCVAYYNSDTPPVLQVISPSQYFYDKTGNKIVIESGLPSEVNTVMTAPIVVTYQTNPSIISQYPVIKQAGLLLLTHLYNNRSNTTANIMHDIPFGVAQLLRPYKPLVL